MDLKSRYLTVLSELKEANSKLSGKAKLIAVSKKFSVEDILTVNGFGQKDFAENYVNELLTKVDALKNLDINWHFIGHLQTNKVDKVVGLVDLIHSVDSLKLMTKINQVSEKKKINQKILLQVKFGDEQTKSGIKIEEVQSVFKQSQNMSSIEVCGLMTILPLGLMDDQKKECFRQLQEVQLKIMRDYSAEKFNELSMGMSDDFKLAISAGSTMIRVGTAIFGARS